MSAARAVSVPLRGVGCFDIVCYFHNLKLFPSPCGVWVVSYDWHHKLTGSCGFRPLAGGGLFHTIDKTNTNKRNMVSVPLRGVGCF